MLSLINKIFKIKKKANRIKIGILYVCTGKYHIFWDKFYLSCQNFFCRNSEVYYFVFTEFSINKFENKNVNHFYQKKLGWPYDTLNRFHLFLSKREELEKMDFLFFFNANMEIKSVIKEKEILPLETNSGLVSVLHSSFYNHNQIPPFEDNKESVAYVETNIVMNYHQGCLSGGRTKEYLLMAEKIKNMVDIDLSKNIIGKWWDESYMNYYFQKNIPKSLPPSFAYPEGGKLPLKVKVLMFEKTNYGGHDFLRN